MCIHRINDNLAFTMLFSILTRELAMRWLRLVTVDGDRRSVVGSLFQRRSDAAQRGGLGGCWEMRFSNGEQAIESVRSR